MEQSRLNRAERYSELASKAQAASNAASKSSSDMLSVIPFGQPVHGAADRNYRDRAASKMDKALEMQRKADYYSSKAEAAANNTAIYADDSDALAKLRSKLKGLTEAQELMKTVNAYYRKNKSVAGCPGVSDDLAAKLEADMHQQWHLSDVPFAAYSLSNNNAEIHRIKGRIASMEAVKSSQPVEMSGDGYQYREDAEIMRIQFVFDGKPDDTARGILKSHGFRWAPSQGAWQRQLTANGKYAAKQVMESLTKL